MNVKKIPYGTGYYVSEDGCVYSERKGHVQKYEGKPIADVPPDVLEQAQAELDKARAAGQEWNRLNRIRLKGKTEEEM